MSEGTEYRVLVVSKQGEQFWPSVSGPPLSYGDAEAIVDEMSRVFQDQAGGRLSFKDDDGDYLSLPAWNVAAIAAKPKSE